MKKAIFRSLGLAIFCLSLALSINNNVKRNQAIDNSLKAISIGSSAAAEDGSNHGRPLKWNGSAYKCDNCTGTDCGAAC